jgi:phage-related baseplate assembly protein
MADKEITFVPVDAEVIEREILATLEAGTGEFLFPGDERRLFGEAMTMTAVALLNYINDAAKQRLLRYARGEILDALGEMRGVNRLEPEKAHIVIRFSCQAIPTSNITIPQGTNVGDGGALVFSTDTVAVISAGQSAVDVLCTSTSGGSIYANISVGVIARLIDLVPGVSEVTNIEPSIGGDDGETYDEAGDAHFRERIQLASGGFSAAGSEEAYRFWALSADPDIAAVAVANPSDGRVAIVPIMRGGMLPSQSVLDKIVTVCSDEKVRPMTDLVTAVSPIPALFDINVKYFTDAASENATVTAVESANGSIKRYIEWQMTQLGRDINPDRLRKEILDAGAMRVVVTKPSFLTLDVLSVAQFSGNLTVTHEVAEE